MKWLCLIITLFLTACASQPTGDQHLAADINVELGLDYLQKGYTDEAKVRLIRAKLESPSDPAVLDAYAYYLEVIGDESMAAVFYLKAINENRDSGLAHNNYGTYLCHQHLYQAAIQQFMLAVQDPQYSDVGPAYENATLCALQMHNQKLAKQYDKKARLYESDLKMTTSKSSWHQR